MYAYVYMYMCLMYIGTHASTCFCMLLLHSSKARILYKKWSSHHSQQKSPQCSLKNDRMISLRFQGKPFSITVKSMP